MERGIREALKNRILSTSFPPIPRSLGKVRCKSGDIFLLDAYYKERGWDPKSGIPTKEKLVSLGLKDVAADLEARGIFASGR